MTSGTSKAHAVGMAVVLGFVAAGAAVAQPSGSEGRTVEGTWYIQVTPIICATGSPVPAVVPINSLVTFVRGGTLTESAGGVGFAPGQRSPGHGTWHHDGGQTYDQKFVAMINFTTSPGPGPGFKAGWQTVTQTVRLIDRDHLESSGTNAFYELDGDPPVPHGLFHGRRQALRVGPAPHCTGTAPPVRFCVDLRAAYLPLPAGVVGSASPPQRDLRAPLARVARATANRRDRRGERAGHVRAVADVRRRDCKLRR